MRIEFPHEEREAFDWQREVLRIGSAPDNDLVLPPGEVMARHLKIQRRPEGLVLSIEPGAGRVYVNARPVRERALLRYGDVLGLGRCRLLLSVEAPAAGVREDAGAECTVALRAVSGPLSGRVWSLRRRLEFGATGIALPMPIGEVASWWLERRDGRLWVGGDAAAERHGLRFDGRRAAPLPARVRPGEQISLGLHRFVVEAPGGETDPGEPVGMPPSPKCKSRLVHGETFWLVVTAAVLAIGVALALQLLSSH